MHKGSKHRQRTEQNEFLHITLSDAIIAEFRRVAKFQELIKLTAENIYEKSIYHRNYSFHVRLQL